MNIAKIIQILMAAEWPLNGHFPKSYVSKLVIMIIGYYNKKHTYIHTYLQTYINTLLRQVQVVTYHIVCW